MTCLPIFFEEEKAYSLQMLDAKNIVILNGHFPTYGSKSNVINNVFYNVLQKETMHLLHIPLILKLA